MLSFLTHLNDSVSRFVWGPVMLIAFLAIGLLFTVRSGFFQVRHFRYWLKSTLLDAFLSRNPKPAGDSHSITQFQSLCTALAATVGTGNIAGVATAITLGGPGAIFWMWISSFLGMMTSFAEKALGLKYRYRDREGNWVGGAFVYMERGLHCKPMAVFFCIACILASFGIGNMVQVNTIADSLSTTFQIKPYETGFFLTILVSLVILGGIKRIASVTEKMVPFMGLFYLAGGLFVLAVNCREIPDALLSIFSEAFNFRSAGGGACGYGMMCAVRIGISRGVFSNEAGLGSSVMAHSASDATDPAKQGMWGICEVFIDTIVLCSITALVILTSGVYDQQQCLSDMAHGIPVLTGAPLTSAAFETALPFGDTFLAVAVMLFAFATVIGWSYFGEQAVIYLFGKKAVFPYKLLYIALIFCGCMASLELVWNISDTFNGLMAIPNLIAITLLSGEAILMLKKHIAGKP